MQNVRDLWLSLVFCQRCLLGACQYLNKSWKTLEALSILDEGSSTCAGIRVSGPLLRKPTRLSCLSGGCGKGTGIGQSLCTGAGSRQVHSDFCLNHSDSHVRGKGDNRRPCLGLDFSVKSGPSCRSLQMPVPG